MASMRPASSRTSYNSGRNEMKIMKLFFSAVASQSRASHEFFINQADYPEV
jgi:hypothetical protein